MKPSLPALNIRQGMLIWMNMPSHHQSAFFDAVRKSGIDLVVHYYGRVTEERKRQGWDDAYKLSIGERFVSADSGALEVCPDWRTRIHVVPGYGAAFLRKLSVTLSHNGVSWMHWSEPAFPGMRWWLSYPRKRWYAGLVNKYAIGAMAIGEMARRDFLRWGIREDKIHFLPYAVAGVSTSERDEIVAEFTSPFDCCFLFLGALCHRKGVEHLLAAFSKVVEHKPNACLVLVGMDQGNGFYHRMAEKLKITSNVFFRGPVPAGSIGSILECCQVLVLPSRFDGWGMVISEAASAGKALIVTTACGAAHHLIREGENGYRVAPGDQNALVDRMTRYAAVPSLALSHGALSRAIFEQYTPKQNAMRLQEILRSIPVSGPLDQAVASKPARNIA